MGSKIWYIFSAILLVSVRANRYDQGPQRFYDVSYDDPITSEQNENKEVIVYLSPDQVKALEAQGAVVRSAEESENEVADSGLESEAQENNEQEETPEQEENVESQPEKETQADEEENLEEEQDQDIDFEQILRILNEEEAEEEETREKTEEQALNEAKFEEENTDSPRNFSPRITLSQKQLEQAEYIAPAQTKKEQILKTYSLIRYQPNEPSQRANIQLFQQQKAEPTEAEETSEEPQTEAPTQEKRRYRLIPYEVNETPASEPEASVEEPAQQITEELNSDTESRAERKSRIQSILRELKAKYNDQKYAIEIERLKAALEKQKAENVAKTVPALIKQQLNKKSNDNKNKQEKSREEQEKPQQLKLQRYSLPVNARAIAVPVIKSEKFESQRTIPVPVETQRVSVKNVYVRTRTDKPFIITRRVPENKRQSFVEAPTNKPERITILRHIWEQ